MIFLLTTEQQSKGDTLSFKKISVLLSALFDSVVKYSL